MTGVKFAGHVINEEDIKSNPEKGESVRKMVTPQNFSNVRRFPGVVNQVGRFIPHLAEKAKPLKDLLSKKNGFECEQTQQESFEKLQDELSSTPVLAHHDPEKRTILSADASSYGLGAVLVQERGNKELKPIAYAMRSMTNTE